jgi:hypothetical protein
VPFNGKKKRLWLWSGGSAVATYFLLYLVLSWFGGWHFSQTGKVRYQGAGLAASDVVRFSPAGVRWERFTTIGNEEITRANLLGYIYSPLLRVERTWIRPDRVIFDIGSNGEVIDRSNNPR